MYCSTCGASTVSSVSSTPDKIWLVKARIVIGVCCLIFGISLSASHLLQPIAEWTALIALLLCAICWSLDTIDKRIRIGFVILALILVVGINGFEGFRKLDKERQGAVQSKEANRLNAQDRKSTRLNS